MEEDTTNCNELVKQSIAAAWNRTDLPQTQFAEQVRELATAVKDDRSLSDRGPDGLAADVEGLLRRDRGDLSRSTVARQFRTLAAGYEEAPEMEASAIGGSEVAQS